MVLPVDGKEVVANGAAATAAAAEKPPEAPAKRERWSSRWTFIIASCGSAIGLGNVWRFPFLMYKHGGGAFLIPYFIFLLSTGLPLLQTELALGATHLAPALPLPPLLLRLLRSAVLPTLRVLCAKPRQCNRMVTYRALFSRRFDQYSVRSGRTVTVLARPRGCVLMGVRALSSPYATLGIAHACASCWSSHTTSAGASVCLAMAPHRQ